MATPITLVEIVLATHGSQTTQANTVAVVVHGIGNDESNLLIPNALQIPRCFCCRGYTSYGAAIDNNIYCFHDLFSFVLVLVLALLRLLPGK